MERSDLSIIYTAATRLGGVGLANVVNHAVHAIHKAGWLKKAIVYGNRQQSVPKSLVKVVRFQPTKVFSALSSRYYYSMKRMWLDADHCGRKGLYRIVFPTPLVLFCSGGAQSLRMSSEPYVCIDHREGAGR